MNSNFSVKILKKTKKKLNKKFKPYKEQIIEKLLKLEINPLISSKHLEIEKLKGLEGEFYRIKFYLPDGSARSIYRLDRKEKECIILEIDYRENIDYKKIKKIYQ